jgi:putative transposase
MRSGAAIAKTAKTILPAYIAIAVGFVYLAAILDAWLRRVVGYAIGRRIDAMQGVHHSDQGSQYAADDYHSELDKHGLKGSMGRRGNPYDNAKAESFMKTLKVEEV